MRRANEARAHFLQATGRATRGLQVLSERTRLSKSRFVAGVQCTRRLWWTVHDPDARELKPDAQLQAVFDNGSHVGERAREFVPGGVLIDMDHRDLDAAIEATRAAIEGGADVIYEACVRHEGVFAAIDILQRRPEGGWTLIEVKSTLGAKPQHVPDLAIQTWVARGVGIDVRRAELMHLDRECRFPDLSNLFTRVDMTEKVEAWVEVVPDRLDEQRHAIAGVLPSVQVGPQCNTPYTCPFTNRCWPKLPRHHVSELYCIAPERAATLEENGFPTIHELTPEIELFSIAGRQRAAVQSGKVVVKDGLADALAVIEEPVACLDFETVMSAIPTWRGAAPYAGVPVQFSVHTTARAQQPASAQDEGVGYEVKPLGAGERLVADSPSGPWRHVEHIAEGADDPRPPLVDALLQATAGSGSVLAWHAPFERDCILQMARAVPERAKELRALADRLVDLLPIVRKHVYHPEFHGSFSLKKVLPALVPELAYAGMEISDGWTASATLQTMLLRPEGIADERQGEIRTALLDYCRRDTEALVGLLDRLRGLASHVTEGT